MGRNLASISVMACGLALLLASSCHADGAKRPHHTLTVTSKGFSDGGSIPAMYTCQGEDVSPDLHWSGAPEGAKSYVVMVEDPDAPDPEAPKTIWVHWIVYDLTVTSLPERQGKAPAPARDGKNGWGLTGYKGPCPPIGEHRYFFDVFALDTLLGDLDSPDREALLRAMEGHVLAKGRLMGRYRKH